MKQYLLLLLFNILIFNAFAQESPLSEQEAVKTVLSFIKKNPTKASVSLKQGEGYFIRYNDEELKPIGSLINLVVAIEYAQQASQHKIEPEMSVELEAVSKYNMNSGQYQIWKDYMTYTRKIRGNRVRIKDIATGMITFSSEACAEFIMEILGVDNINNQLQKLKMFNHTPIYPLSSARILCHNPYLRPAYDYMDSLRKLSQKEYINASMAMHRTIQEDSLGKIKSSFKSLEMFAQSYRELWSERVPQGNMKDYLMLLELINKREYFSEEEQIYLDYILERIPMKSDEINVSFVHCGFMTASTNSSLSLGMYVVDKKGRKIQISCCFDQLSRSEHIDLSEALNSFAFEILEHQEVMAEVKKELENTYMPNPVKK